MPVEFENFSHSFLVNGRRVFVPNERGSRIGSDLKARVEDAVQFPRFYNHLHPGGHIAALHEHRRNRFFARLDIERFFYGIGRNRVVRALRESGIPRAEHYGKWSCVRSPYEEPRYALPYGFVQSPILATLVLRQSPTGASLDALSDRITVSVYMDDLSMSSNDVSLLSESYEALQASLTQSGFAINVGKSRLPAETIDIFNCDLRHGSTAVTAERIARFYGADRTPFSEAGFLAYCEAVARGNA